LLGLISIVLWTQPLQAVATTVVPYAGGSYTQTFNSLPDSTPDPSTAYDVADTAGPVLLGGSTGLGGTAMNGWYFARAAGTSTSTLFRVGPGSGPGAWIGKVTRERARGCPLVGVMQAQLREQQGPGSGG
jgi:hypothetical protein